MTTPTPLVSAIIPVFNGERYLGEAIRSIQAQSNPAGELVVIDDGSSDGSAALAQRLAPEARYFHQPNQGAGAARNLGASVARGRFLAFLDADDLWPVDKLARQLAAFQSESSADIITGLVEQFRSPDLDPAAAARLHCPAQLQPGFLFGAMLIRREAFDRVGPLKTNLTVGETVDWLARATALGVRISTLPELALRRRLHHGNLGVRFRHCAGDYARVLKGILDHRRATARGAEQKEAA
jgi:glycosyltransferase involved in cell wall biosynthesis